MRAILALGTVVKTGDKGIEYAYIEEVEFPEKIVIGVILPNYKFEYQFECQNMPE